MKIMEHRHMDDRGIRIICPICNCEYIIEDRNDWTIYRDGYFDFDKLVTVEFPTYAVRCPECDYEINFGNNPNKTPCSWGRSPMFNREDWDERYDVKLE